MPYRSSSSMSGSEFVLVIIFVAIFIVCAIIADKKEQKRKKTIARYCSRANLGYEHTIDYLPGCRSFTITSRGVSQGYYAIMSGKKLGIEFKIMDFYYNVGGKNGGHNCSLCIFTKKGLDLPHFYAREENSIFDGIGEFFGGQDIDFDDDPDFSSSYVLQGNNERAIRRLFNRKIRNAFTRAAEYSYEYEGLGDHFLVVDSNGFKDVAARKIFLHDAIKVYAAILFNSGRA